MVFLIGRENLRILKTILSSSKNGKKSKFGKILKKSNLEIGFHFRIIQSSSFTRPLPHDLTGGESGFRDFNQLIRKPPEFPIVRGELSGSTVKLKSENNRRVRVVIQKARRTDVGVLEKSH